MPLDSGMLRRLSVSSESNRCWRHGRCTFASLFAVSRILEEQRSGEEEGYPNGAYCR